MQRQALSRSATQTALLLAVFGVFLSAAAALRAAIPYNSATVTRVENQVRYGQVKEGRRETRLANPQDVVKASDFLLSEKDSRAELKYLDGTIVRIGQNTVFSFDASTRTFYLEKGTMVGYVPKGSGGATVKTPTYTAAITGTTFKCSGTRFAVIIGSVTVTLRDGSTITVNAGEYIEFDADGNLVGGIHEYVEDYTGALLTDDRTEILGGDPTPLPSGTPLEIPSIPGVTFEDATATNNGLTGGSLNDFDGDGDGDEDGGTGSTY